MAILTNAKYNDLWIHNPNGTDSFATITRNPIPPSHADYVIRENMLEDYLDIFRGVNTRHHRPMPAGGWYYEHPFFNANGIPLLENVPCIRYVLIGEACPSDGNNYFYDVNELNSKGQVYLRSSYNATYGGLGPTIPWNVMSLPTDKTQKLVDLARRGVLLIDLFPFAINYNQFRIIFNKTDITRSFWNDIINVNNLEIRLSNLSPLLSENWDLCMISPNLVSEFIVDSINKFIELVAIPRGLHIRNFREISVNELRRNNWKKIAVDTSGNPNPSLITEAFI
jgi:hypothetical protein